MQGYGGHTIRPDCALTDANDSDVILIPPIFNDIEQTLVRISNSIGEIRHRVLAAQIAPE